MPLLHSWLLVTILARGLQSVYHTAMTYRIFIDGAAGTTGLQVHGRLDAHPSVMAVTLDDAARKDPAARRAMMAECDLTILCLPDDAARDSAALAAEVGARVIDASTAHRTTEGWDYGFVELSGGARDAVAASARISNPGCYPTGFLALARPLVEAGIIAPDAGLVVPAVSGYSGGGKGMIGKFDAGEMPPHGAYGLTLAHKHVPEMTHYAGLDRAPIFMPSVGSFYAGMLVHLPLHAAQLAKRVTAGDIQTLYDETFSASPFIRMGLSEASDPEVAAAMLDAAALAGQDHMELFVFGNEDDSRIWLTARLDNLGKGASGAAVQNMNIALGLDETAGLSV